MKIKSTKVEFKSKQSGITLIALVITIIVLLIIAGITTYSGTALIKQAHFEDIKTTMLLIQAKAKVRLEDKKFDDSVELYGSQSKPSDLVNNSGEDLTEYYYLSENDLRQMNLGNLKVPEGEYYLVKYDIDNLDVEVLYTLGVEDSEGNVYYKLSEFQQ